MLASTLLAVFGLSATITAAPTKRDNYPDYSGNPLSAENLIGIAPSTASCDPNAQFANECRDATTAAHCIQKSFEDYGIKSWGVQAALVSLIMFESGNFSYSAHHFPTEVAGQGTRNMQSIYNNEKYAEFLKGNGSLSGTDLETATNSGPNGVLDLLNANDHFSFGSAAWYLMIQCPNTYYDGLSEETDEAYKDYLSNCVGAGSDTIDARLPGYHAVQSLLHW